jgi:sterol desaturase/sphingolipid hydroxylase (fatty acid hydroxylase superfamily)
MNWMRFAAVVLGAGVVTTFTDWFFAGDWLHTRLSYPEIWRKGNDLRSVALSMPLPFITSAAFAVLAWKLDVEGLRNCIKLAAAIWAVAPLPLILANAVFIKLPRVFVVSYSAGWLVKLLIVAVAVGKFLHY